MSLSPIVIAAVTDLTGKLEWLELRQNGNTVKLTLSDVPSDSPNGYRWREIKTAIDKLQKELHDKADKDIRR